MEMCVTDAVSIHKTQTQYYKIHAFKEIYKLSGK